MSGSWTGRVWGVKARGGTGAVCFGVDILDSSYYAEASFRNIANRGRNTTQNEFEPTPVTTDGGELQSQETDSEGG